MTEVGRCAAGDEFSTECILVESGLVEDAIAVL